MLMKESVLRQHLGERYQLMPPPPTGAPAEMMPAEEEPEDEAY